MRQYLQIIGLFLFTLAFQFSQAQCPACTLDPTCPTQVPSGGLCPSTLPAATAGAPYCESISFYIPYNTVEGGFNINVLSINITQIDGLPMGLNWVCDNAANGCAYTPVDNQTTGCVTLSGSAITAPGVYNVVVTANAQVFIIDLGAEINFPGLTFETTIEVLESEGAITFSYDGMTNCEANDYVVDFTASITDPNCIVDYLWDFGNGNTSTLQNPTETFVAPGSYNVSLQTQLSGYTLTEMCVNSVSDNWCGDVEEVATPFVGTCIANPDLYFELIDANGAIVYTSPVEDGVLSACWTGLNIQLSNPPYSINIWDDDPVSVDDDLGVFAFNPGSTGALTYSGTTGVANGTAGVMQIGSYVKDTFNEDVFIAALANPFAVNLSFVDPSTPGATDGSIDVNVSGGTPTYMFDWSNGATTEDLFGIGAGNYSVVITDGNGCTSFNTVTLNDDILLPVSLTSFYGYNVDRKYNQIYWETAAELDMLMYAVERSTDGINFKPISMAEPLGNFNTANRYDFIDDELESNLYYYRLNMLEKNGVQSYSEIITIELKAETAINIYPNPVINDFTIDYTSSADDELLIQIFDLSGKVCFSQEVALHAGANQIQLSIDAIPSGSYFVRLFQEGNQELTTKRIIKYAP